MTTLYSIRLTAFILFLTSSSCLCFAEQGIFLTDDLQLRVADSFMEQGEYYRAVTEYKRFAILFPDSPKGDYVLFRIGIAYYLGEEYGDAVSTFEKLAAMYPAGPYYHSSRYFDGLCLWKKKDYVGAVAAFEGVAQSASFPFAPKALAAWSLLELDRDDPAAAAVLLQRFITDYPDHQGITEVREACSLLAQYEDLPQKSEILAGILSAILPVAGYVYAGRYGDGLTSFLINGLFIAGTVTAVNNDWLPAAGISGGIGLPFYLGNIYGSVNAAKKWNRTIKSEMRSRIDAALEDIVAEKDCLPMTSLGKAVLPSSLPKQDTSEVLPESQVDRPFPCFTNMTSSDSI
ncbi:MAG: tetratricopeptide repeat protein [Syntrophobacterales bacterium]|nr:MAG: tetratricopeptide repeat protein [Syntrophobacterales bacterium]